jgi:hypothetical protein
MERPFFFMKNFLYLRVNAIVGITVSFALTLIGLLGIIMKEDRQLPLIVFIIAFLLLFMLPAVHNFLIIYIYHNHYPAEEIPPLSRILNTVFSILCLIDLLLLVFALLFEAPKNDFSEKNSLRIWTAISCMIILVITIGIQVTGSFRLIKKVMAGARQQLDSSFV